MSDHPIDPNELAEWRQALDTVIEFEGSDYAKGLLDQLLQHAEKSRVGVSAGLNSAYANTISADQQAALPDDGTMATKLTNMMRWNAIAMVMRAGKFAKELGGHIASFASIATLYETGFTYFFNRESAKHGGDLVYFQGHSSPGIYARSYLEGVLSENQLVHFRQEISGNGDGISSYPHSWLMPDYWQFATVSMGLGPLMAIYQAQFLKYLDNRGLADTKDRHVWAFCGDGEMGEPESLGALNIAGRDQLDNLIFVINCNLQRLDGAVWGNGQIIQEFERVYRGAGWHVIKVIWGKAWDKIFERDTQGLVMQRISDMVDGEYQAISSRGIDALKNEFFGKTPELAALVSGFTDDDFAALQDGGHDLEKVYAAYKAAVDYKDGPTVILAKTVKGYGMGASGEGQNKTHQAKKMAVEDLKAFRDRFALELTDEQVEKLEFIKPAEGSPEQQYLVSQREKLGGFLPHRRRHEDQPLVIPELSAFQAMLDGSGEREISSTMAFVRVLSTLLKDKNIKDRVVPIMADESRTFGMEGLFRQIGIYAPFGQKYVPEDKHELMYYREDKKGQLMQQGLSEPAAMSCWIAAATSYSNSNTVMIPFYVYYSMFGFQRVGDLAWAAGDMRARGFIMGGTAGRTTLAGEGLQHQDGHNILMFDMVPNCLAYDPCYSYEVATIIHNGLVRMYQNQEDVYYYITLMNENYTHPAMPEGVADDIVKGLYQLRSSDQQDLHVDLIGAGTILREVEKAADILAQDYNVSANIYSATSFTELYRNMRSVTRENNLHPDQPAKQSHVKTMLGDVTHPIIAATDYIHLYAQQISADLQAPYYVLGTDGYGRSDTRKALREHFEVNHSMIAYLALKALFDQGQYSEVDLLKARDALGVDPDQLEPISH